ncbi:MAG: LysR family transcriptional regulator [Arenicellales bacterium]
MDSSGLRRLDLNLLRSLDVLLEVCNVTHAARRLHLSQPAVSAQLRQLREAFADPLLVPAARGMTRTATGEALRAPLRGVLLDLEELLAARQDFDPVTAGVTFRVSASDLIHSVISVPLITRWRERAPGIRLALLPFQPGRVEQPLAAGDVDVILLVPHALAASLRRRELYREHFACVMRRDHPASRGRLTLRRYCAYEHALVSPEGGGFHGAVDDALKAAGHQRRVVASLPSFLMVPGLLAHSDLLCTVPYRLTRTWGDGLAFRRPPCEIEGFRVEMAWHARTDADPARRWLREEIEAIATSVAHAP